ncbi:DNA polymerase [Dictyobacter arantiisoli]|uniref:DNA polymerase I n=1 Tax=Dictyobacter arantiisoli TaxID=2014874 RepID=A0A5A5T774_9CHLR|nr:DNA polymerase [Dictyobacter arantiisoli]GCF07331.1 bifunctional 3'-5' exonuclease/DNA polymerase [Dictyobacter arantiisoli]
MKDITTLDFLAELRQRRIEVTSSEGKLHIHAPKGVCTPELKTQLQERKAELLMTLAQEAKASLASAPDTCATCQTPIDAEDRDFCYTPSGACYCIPCWERQLDQPLTSSQSLALLKQCFHDHTELAIDLETTGLNARTCKVVSITVGTPEKTVIIDTRPYYHWSEMEQWTYRNALQQFFHQSQICWIGHNLKFDWQFLAVHFGIGLRSVYDTMLAEQLLEHREISLKATVAHYQLGEMHKEERSWFIDLDRRPGDWSAAFPAGQCTYMRQDVVQAYHVFRKQRASIEAGQLTQVVALENSALPALAAMEVHGALIDVARWKKVLQAKRERQAELEPVLQEGLIQPLRDARAATYQEYQQAVRNIWSSPSKVRPSCPVDPWKPINLSSADDLKEALAVAGIHVESTREEALEVHKAHASIIKPLLEWRKLQHFCDAFGENLLAHIQIDGRIHADFRQIGAVSGRIICNKPNLQQIPKKAEEESDDVDLRQCFVAAPGNVLLTADLSNIELRILADFARDKAMLRFFAEGKDLHAETAKLMFGLPEETNTKKHLYKGVAVRSIAKTINFGLAYGMGASGLAGRTGVSLDEARSLMRKYFDTYAGVARFLKQSAASALRKGYATTASGRKRSFPTASIQSQSERGRIERSAKNHPIQGTNADVLKRALALLYTTLPEVVHITLTVHDEIVLECPSDLVEEATRILQGAMVQACRDYLPVVHIPEPDVLIDTCWRKE